MPCPEPYQSVMEADLLFRPLVPEDITAVLDIELQGYSYPWSEAVFLDCFKDSYRFWAACQGESLVGYAVVTYVVGEAHLCPGVGVVALCNQVRASGRVGVGRVANRDACREPDIA